MTAILLDTCAVIWTADDEKISQDAIVAIDESFDKKIPLCVSPITAWELGLLVSRGRYRISMEVTDWFSSFIDRSMAHLVDLTADELIASSFLPGNPPADPADRIIIAVARQNGYRIMTRDRKILDYAHEGYVNAIEC